MKKKGFTLIELLAVIVVLAIIALIAVPIILNVIEKAKLGSTKNSVLGYIEAVEQQIAVNLVDSNKKEIKDGKYTVDVLKSDYNLIVKGKAPDSGWVLVKDNVVTECELQIGDYSATCDNKDITVNELNEDMKNIPDDRMMDSYLDGNIYKKSMLQFFDNTILVTDDEQQLLNSQFENQMSYFFPTVELSEPNITGLEKIQTVSYNEVPDDAIISKDISAKQNESVMVWFLDEDNDSLLEIYIGQDGGVIAPKNASMLFYGLFQFASDTSSTEIEFDFSKLNTKYTTDMSGMFMGYPNSSIDISNFDTHNVTKMNMMFSATGLTSIDLSDFNTESVTDMSFMFMRNEILKNINVSGLDTSDVTDMTAMFMYIPVTNLDLSNFNTKKVTRMTSMFYGSEFIETLDLSNFDTSKVTNMSYMFGECSNLKTLKIGNVTIPNPSTMFEKNDQLN